MHIVVSYPAVTSFYPVIVNGKLFPTDRRDPVYGFEHPYNYNEHVVTAQLEMSEL